jgi:hypothetical protein
VNCALRLWYNVVSLLRKSALGILIILLKLVCVLSKMILFSMFHLVVVEKVCLFGLVGWGGYKVIQG